MHLPSEFRCKFVDQLGDGESFCDVSGQIAHSCEMPHKQRKNLMRIHKRARTIHCSDAVSIAVRSEPRVVFSGGHGLLQGRNVRLDRFGVRAAKARIVRSADFVTRYSIALKKFRQQPGCGAVHRVKEETEFGFPDALPIHQFFKSIQIRFARVERMNQLSARR